jgi:TolB-like protein/DNA-binding winged helix-turn-helix (wHTH) protein/tetratricopeptide (TPR) repeat protein
MILDTSTRKLVFTAQHFQFGEFTLDQSRYRLQRGDRVLRLEKRPMELLILLVERRGELVSRDEIAGRLWSKDVFVDVEHGINTAIRKVRQVLGDDPEKPRFVETVIGKGYCFAAPVSCGNGDSKALAIAADPVPQIQPQPLSASAGAAVAARPGRSTRKPLWIASAVMLTAVVACGVVLVRRGHTRPVAPPPIKSLAVLPLKNLSADPTQEYLADGMTEELIGRLAAIHDLRVISRTSVVRFKETKLSAPEIGKELGVDSLVEGSVLREGSRIRVHAQLIRAASDEHFWSETYDRELQDVLSLESDVAQAIAGKVEVTLSGKERERLTVAHPVAPEVFENYLKGLHAFSASVLTKAAITQGIGYFSEAIKLDPTFAPAYLGLAYAYDLLGSNFIGGRPQEALPKELNAARRAIELDPNLAEAHALLAYVQRRQYRWAEAKSEYQRAFELNPNSADVHDGLSQWFLSQGQTEEALAWDRRARQLDPVMVPGTNIGWILFCARRYAEAEQETRSVLALDPDDSNALWTLGIILVGNHQPEKAIAVLENALAHSERSPGVMGMLINAYAQAGRRAEALRLLAALKEKQKQRGFVPAGAFVNAYLGLRENDQAFAWLEQAYQEQSNLLQVLKVHPFFDPIRSDPRFADLLRRAGLDQAR